MDRNRDMIYKFFLLIFTTVFLFNFFNILSAQNTATQNTTNTTDTLRVTADVYLSPKEVYKPKIKITKHEGVILISKENYGQPGWLEMGIELLCSLGEDWYIFSSQDLPVSMRFRNIISFDTNIAKTDYSQEILTSGTPKIENDDHLFRILNVMRAKALFVYGINDRAKIIGGFYLGQLARQDSDLIWKLDGKIRHPKYPIRIVGGDTPINSLAMGYNIFMPDNSDPAKLVFFKKILPPIFDKENKNGIERTINNRKKIVQNFIEAKNSKLDICICGDEFLFPRELISSPFAEQILSANYSAEQADLPAGVGNIFCFARPTLWNFVKAKYSDILSDFKDIDFVMVRLGENSSSGKDSPYVGNGVYPFGTNMTCSFCENIPYEDRIAKTINEIHKIVVKENGRYYIHRTWDTKLNLFHSNPEVFKKIVSKIESKEKLFLSTKYTMGDFWEYFDYNPTFAEAKDINRIAEFQCTREYEGKGAFPNFLGDEFSKAYTYLSDKSVAGVWNWHHGGGGGGPKIKLDLWNQANIYAASRFMWEPTTKPQIIAEDFASMTFGKDSAKNISQLLLKSPIAIKKAFYFEKYSQNHKNWAPSELWTRDDVIRGEKELFKIYRECKNDLNSLIVEKKESLKIVKEMKEILLKEKKKILKQEKIYIPWLDNPVIKQRFLSGEQIFDAAMTSLEYEESLFKVFHDYCEVYFFGLKWNEDRKESDKIRAENALQNWKNSWKFYNEEISKLPYAATLFKDDGMTSVIIKIEKYLTSSYSQKISWMVIGPFSNLNKKGFDEVFPPETTLPNIDFSKAVKGFGNIDVSWKKIPTELILDNYIDLDPLFNPSDWITIYLAAKISVDREREAILSLGTDDGVKVWLNGMLVHQNDVYRGAKNGEDKAKVSLKYGENIILLKITEGIFGTGFYFEILDEKGEQIHLVSQ